MAIVAKDTGRSQDAGRIKDMLDACDGFLDDMSEWEQQFVESVTEQFERSGSLSPKQVEILEGIYERLP